jgi:hypothetical protein
MVSHGPAGAKKERGCAMNPERASVGWRLDMVRERRRRMRDSALRWRRSGSSVCLECAKFWRGLADALEGFTQ